MVMERMQILVTAEQRNWLEGQSERVGLPVTAVVRSAIDAARGVRPESQRRAALNRLLAHPLSPDVSVQMIDDELATRYRSVAE